MANFTTPPLWTNEGTAPSETLKTNGFQAGYKPPAPIFNYMFNKYGICLTELQQDANKKVGKSLAGQTVIIDDTAPQTTAVAGVGAEIFNDYRTRDEDVDGSTGFGNVATGDYSHAEGAITTATGDFSHAEGVLTEAEGKCSHAEGQGTIASGYGSHAEGFGTIAEGDFSHAEGRNTHANGKCSHAGGYGTTANGYQFVTGKYNAEKTGCTDENDQSTENSIFIIGNGTPAVKANAFRIRADGKCMGTSSFGSSGADYAEYWEIEGGNSENKDLRGHFVTVNNDNKIKIANADDYILGVISANPSVVGDVQSENWHGMYKKDVFGQTLTETVEIPESTDEKTGEVIPAHTVTRLVVNPDYDPDKEYISREFRNEWACVGLLGKIVVVDDGTCKAGEFCKVANGGIATRSEKNDGWRVLQRIDETHIKIMYR